MLSSTFHQSYLWIYRPIHDTDLFILSGVDLEYTEDNTFKI